MILPKKVAYKTTKKKQTRCINPLFVRDTVLYQTTYRVVDVTRLKSKSTL